MYPRHSGITLAAEVQRRLTQPEPDVEAPTARRQDGPTIAGASFARPRWAEEIGVRRQRNPARSEWDVL